MLVQLGHLANPNQFRIWNLIAKGNYKFTINDDIAWLNKDAITLSFLFVLIAIELVFNLSGLGNKMCFIYETLIFSSCQYLKAN